MNMAFISSIRTVIRTASCLKSLKTSEQQVGDAEGAEDCHVKRGKSLLERFIMY